MLRRAFREKTLATTHNSLHNPLWFSSTPTFLFLNSWEVDSPNTCHTHPECNVRFWCCWEALEEAICSVDAIRLNCMIWRAREDKAWRSQLVVGAWRARVHGGRLGLKGLFLFMYSNLFSSGSIYRLEGGGEVFRQVFHFPFR